MSLELNSTPEYEATPLENGARFDLHTADRRLLSTEQLQAMAAAAAAANEAAQPADIHRVTPFERPAPAEVVTATPADYGKMLEYFRIAEQSNDEQIAA